jgi:hypothetical protein
MGNNGSLRNKLIKAVADASPGKPTAAICVDCVLSGLKTPDAFMVDGGLDELNLALGKPANREHGYQYRRDLIRVIWFAMLDRVR